MIQVFTKTSSSTSHPSALSFTSDVHDSGRMGAQWTTGSFNVLPTCCGSVVPYAHTKQSPPFTREITGPTVDMPAVPPNGRDAIPPSRLVSQL